MTDQESVLSPAEDGVLHYSSPVVLVGAGEVSTTLVERYAALGWPVVCADGGADRLSDSRIQPEVIIGDMDSLCGLDHWRTSVQLVKISEQDTTDFEKCLYTVNAPVYLACGFSGNRFDHTLASLHVLAKYVTTHRVVMTAGEDICFVCNGNLFLTLKPSGRISIYPLSPTLFSSSSGLEYPLDGLLLEQGTAISTSNRITERQVLVKIKYGVYAVILPVECLSDVLDKLIAAN